MAKSRFGFVSNSSSSSFIIGVKGKLTKEVLMECFKIPTDSPLYYLNEELAETLISCVSERGLSEVMSYCDYEDEENNKLLELDEKGFNLYAGSVCDDDGGMEALLCDVELNVNTDDLYIEKQGGY